MVVAQIGNGMDAVELQRLMQSNVQTEVPVGPLVRPHAEAAPLPELQARYEASGTKPKKVTRPMTAREIADELCAHHAARDEYIERQAWSQSGRTRRSQKPVILGMARA